MQRSVSNDIRICLQHVDKIFDASGGASVEALSDANLEVATNEVLCIVGPSGCGKSTLLNLIAGFLLPTSGQVLVDGRNVTGPGPDRAVVFQQDSVFPWLTVVQNLEYGPRARGVAEAERKARVAELLELVGLTEYRHLFPRQLSGGMKKRVDLARAYANDPEILLMDEPFGALDVFTKEKMQIELLRQWQQRKRTIVFITHDIEEAIFIGDRVVVMTPRPARIAREFQVPFEKQSDGRVKTTQPFQQLRQQIMDSLSQAETIGAD
ncbi:MAG: ABC transporter ATP-binding protein [Chloroflexi bacterium]|nr:ABC transporter ATP-binding protein [Chloroflexota bacterium]